VKRRGVTLLELIVCFSVVLLLVIFVLNLFPGALVAQRQSEMRLEAQRQAELVLDLSRQARFDTYALDSSTPADARVLNGVTYKPVLQARAVPGYDGNLLKELRVTVGWDDHGTPRTQTAAAWVSRAH